ncbi:MAG: NUDIX domain-containing protein [bacterium]|nr:NUDIX domain-containing protein [bacterium]
MTIGAFSIILDSGNKVLLCRRRDKDLWNLPGGGVERNESPWAAAVREAQEEIGVDIVIEKLIGVYFKQEQEEIVFQFLSRIEKGIPSVSEESRENAYFDADALPENTAPRQKERIKLFFEDQNIVRILNQ